MTKLLLFSKCFPVVLHLGRLILPLLTNDLGDLWISETWVLSDYVCLVMLTVEYECFDMSATVKH